MTIDAVRRDPLVVVVAIVTALVATSLVALPVPRELYWLLMAMLHAVFAVGAGRLAHGAGKLLFGCTAAAGVVLAIGDLLRIAGLLLDSRTAVDIQQGALGVAIVLLVLGLLRHPLNVPSPGARARLRLDVATVMAGTTTLGLCVFELPSGRHGLRWALELAVGVMLEPGLFLLVIFAIIRLTLGGQSPFTRPAGSALSAAAVLHAFLQGLPDSAYLSDRYGDWLRAASLIGSMLLAVGMRLQHTTAAADDQAGRTARRPYSLLPYAAMGLTWFLAAGLLVTQGLTWRSWLICAGCAVTTNLVVLRQLAAFRHIAELLGERERLTAQLTEQAFRDDLTGLPNRAHFLRRLADMLTAGPVTVFLIDLDEFKPVNDSYGHATGDRLLTEVGARLRATTREKDAVGRLGGDEFAVVMPGHAAHRATDLEAALTGVVRIGEFEVPLSASIGCAEGAEDPTELLHRADLAMYENKRRGSLSRPGRR